MANGKGKNGKKRLFYIIGSVTATLLVALVLVAATRGGSKIDSSKLARVDRGDLAKNVVATGKIQAITQVDVKSKSSGIVKKLYVDYGQMVTKAQVLAELDKELIHARVNPHRPPLHPPQPPPTA